jgi:hypothetical protein
MKKVEKKSNNLGISSLILGLLTVGFFGKYLITAERTTNNLIRSAPNFFIVIGFIFIILIGIIMGLISLFLKVDKKEISLLGILLNLSGPYFIYLCLLASAK